MKMILTAVALAGLSFAGTAEARSPIEGRWAKGNMQIDIKPCGATLCGTVVRASRKQQNRARNGSGTDLIGATLIKQIQPAGPQTYRARVFVADRNMHALGKIRQLSANRLQVSGCALAILCKTTQWIRVR
jgi:uncharacterized protein (DUF2147 family)